MPNIEKLITKLNRVPVPNDMTYTEILRLAEYYGCEVFTGGKHPIRIADRTSQYIVTVPRHGKCVKEAYIKELKILFNEIETRGGAER